MVAKLFAITALAVVEHSSAHPLGHALFLGPRSEPGTVLRGTSRLDGSSCDPKTVKPYVWTSNESLYVSPLIPGQCDAGLEGSCTDCYNGHGMFVTEEVVAAATADAREYLRPWLGFGQYAWVGPFCQPQLQSSSSDPKGQGNDAWGGGSLFGPKGIESAQQAFPYPYYYLDKYRAIAMSQDAPACQTKSASQNSLGWGTDSKVDTAECVVVEGCASTAYQMRSAVPEAHSSDSDTKVDMVLLADQWATRAQNSTASGGEAQRDPLSCLNYMAYTALDDARAVCREVKQALCTASAGSSYCSKNDTASDLVQCTSDADCKAYSTGARSCRAGYCTFMPTPGKGIPNNFAFGYPDDKNEWLNPESCPINTVCLSGPPTDFANTFLNGSTDPQNQYLNSAQYTDSLQHELKYPPNETFGSKYCLPGSDGVSKYDIAQIWLTTFPSSSIDTCSAALITTQGECVSVAGTKVTPATEGRLFPNQPMICSTSGGDSAGGIWQVTTPMGLIPEFCEVDNESQRLVKNSNLCCSAAANVPHIMGSPETVEWTQKGWVNGACMMANNAPPQPGQGCPDLTECAAGPWANLTQYGSCVFGQPDGYPTCESGARPCCYTKEQPNHDCPEHSYCAKSWLAKDCPQQLDHKTCSNGARPCCID